jgi:predicted secreted protein
MECYPTVLGDRIIKIQSRLRMPAFAIARKQVFLYLLQKVGAKSNVRSIALSGSRCVIMQGEAKFPLGTTLDSG